jgi:hypothetical protein
MTPGGYDRAATTGRLLLELEPATSGVAGRRSEALLSSALFYWRTGCRLLGKVLGELTRRLAEQLVKPNSGQESAEIAPTRSPVRVRLAP